LRVTALPQAGAGSKDGGDELCELPQLLGGGREKKFVACAILILAAAIVRAADEVHRRLLSSMCQKRHIPGKYFFIGPFFVELSQKLYFSNSACLKLKPKSTGQNGSKTVLAPLP
jgi:hypothetical protein